MATTTDLQSYVSDLRAALDVVAGEFRYVERAAEEGIDAEDDGEGWCEECRSAVYTFLHRLADGMYDDADDIELAVVALIRDHDCIG